MKITPIILFLILLLVLVLSIIFSNLLPLNNTREGMINFGYNKQSDDNLTIPQYNNSPAKSVNKLYDNIYFDDINGNLIEVDGSVYDFANTVANTVSDRTGSGDGSTITGVYVVKRDGTSNSTIYNTTNGASTESALSSVSPAYSNWVYNTKSTNTDKYQIFYISWNTDTYIHIINTTSSKHIKSFVISGTSIQGLDYNSSDSVSITGTPSSVTDTNDSSYQIEPLYNPSVSVYQISPTVKFDINNGYLIIKDIAANKVNIYNPNGASVSYFQTAIPDTFSKFIKSDNAGNMVLYMTYSKKTVVAILTRNPTTTLYSMGIVTRFNDSGLDNNSTIIPPTSAPSNGVDSDYYKWLAYWNTIVTNPSTSYSQDYLLKTQIVPPVCPSCPSCPSVKASEICTNCGGNGGSGTIGSTGGSLVTGTASGAKQYDMTAKGDGAFVTTANTDTLGGATTTQAMSVVGGVENVANTGAGVVSGTVGTAGDVLKSTGSGATNFAGKVVDKTTGLLSDAGSGAAGLLRDTGSGIAGFARDTGSGVAGFARDTGSGAASLIRDTGSGATSLLQNSGNNQGVSGQSGTSTGQSGTSTGQSGSQNIGGYNTGNSIDKYSYYGALPSKGGNFIPITSDFSAFGK